MTILQYKPDQEEILEFIDQSFQQLAASGTAPRYIVMGTEAFERFRQAVAARLHRKPKHFGTYNHVPVVVDPFRGDAVCVLPEPREMKSGVQAMELPS